MKIQLRDYQIEAINKVKWSTQLEGNDLLQLPTGAGKSIVIAELANYLNTDVLILQPTKEILEQNFIQEPDGSWRTPNPNEAKDRELLRNKALLKEFGSYVTSCSQPKPKKLKEVRVEALRVGFKSCWELKDFKTIVLVGDLIPKNILLEDEQLLMYYDIALDRV